MTRQLSEIQQDLAAQHAIRDEAKDNIKKLKGEHASAVNERRELRNKDSRTNRVNQAQVRSNNDNAKRTVYRNNHEESWCICRGHVQRGIEREFISKQENKTHG